MCGRYHFPEEDDQDDSFRLTLQRMNRQGLSPLPAGDLSPGMEAAVIAPRRSDRKATIFTMLWGFRVQGRMIFNARVETASEKSLFRESFARRRCAVPLSVYYEWDHRLKPSPRYAIRPRESLDFCLAGLYRQEENGRMTFTVLTRPSAGIVADFHDRMPVMLSLHDADAWIHPDLDRPHDFLGSRALLDMVVLSTSGQISFLE